MALMIAPVVRPNSASYWFVMTWNSATASSGVRACDPARCPITSSLLLAPSSMKLLLRESRPLALIASEPNDSVLMLEMTPGSSATMPTKLPFTDGSIVTSRLVTLPPISFDVRSTSGVSAVIVTVSASAADAELHVERGRSSEIQPHVTPAVLRKP